MNHAIDIAEATRIFRQLLEVAGATVHEIGTISIQPDGGWRLCGIRADLNGKLDFGHIEEAVCSALREVGWVDPADDVRICIRRGTGGFK